MGLVFNSCTEYDDLLLQQRCGWPGAKGRLRREDCKFVKHDKLFSRWKILMGPSEQTNCTGMKDGMCKYHIHNLPATQFGPGVYELGVTAPSGSRAPNSQTLKREDVIPVYIGQAANIRQRLQKYGQAADSRISKLHQGDNDSIGSRSPRKGFKGELAKHSRSVPPLFSDALALGSSIAFRWAQTDSKAVAQHVTSELLAVFDYAWNKGTSGTRRSRDILAKLLMARRRKNKSTCRFRTLVFSCKRSLRWLFCSRRNAVGIKVAVRKPPNTTTWTNSILSNLCFLMTVVSSDVRRGTLPCNAVPLKHYEIKPSPHRSASTTILKRQTEPVDTMSFRPRREYFVAAKTKTHDYKQAEEQTAERRRRNSLSFNTWVKGDSTDQRVHDSSNMSTLFTKSSSFQKLNPGSGSRNSRGAKMRVLHLGSKYVSVCDSDSMSR